jgi:hypothetical protein
LGVARKVNHKKYYKGEGGGFPQVWAMVSFVSSCIPMVHHSSDILSIRFKHTRILRIFGLLKKYLKILYTKANFQAFVFL